mmetsp:Transcript_23348/g.22974  ORF Transcript_23348/g.22974 Transcript_23348/m.22974 type:complete len:115 (-) Transcript_23348:400-744(-)|eukprot:CAMPEP_0170540094 /NCGR_PEP_ID=MMETSP0211-20121228/121_1 /TAXON_ID=311385 /ORGANISM="Pseudokeronopsis sp., Strain OXSARD2" /LENGTH=114 /DNA_ID=CAMNT_0010842373 /DNA_START=264 /DNA_END=608 /DNA_ORIENTATION=-
MRGFGESQGERGLFSTKDTVEDGLVFMAKTKQYLSTIYEESDSIPWGIYGNSYGAGVAMSILRDAYEKTNGIFLYEFIMLANPYLGSPKDCNEKQKNIVYKVAEKNPMKVIAKK